MQQVTKTYEPIRPIYCPDSPRPCYYSSLGTPRVYYGEIHWPSKSYWMVPIRVERKEERA
jgi:hypothetical protein